MNSLLKKGMARHTYLANNQSHMENNIVRGVNLYHIYKMYK